MRTRERREPLEPRTSMPPIPRAQDQLFDRTRSAREKYADLVVGQPGWGALVWHELVTLSRSRCRGRWATFFARRSIRRCSARAAGTWSSGATSCCGIRTRSVSANDVVIDDNCLIDAKGDTNRGIDIGSGVFIGRNTILSCKNGDIDVEDWRQHRLQLRALFRQPRAHRPRHAARRLLLRDRRRPRLLRCVEVRARADADVGGRADRRGGMARRRREDPRRRHDRRQGDRRRRGVVREAVPEGAIAVGVPAKIIGQRDAAGRSCRGP